MPDHGKKHRVIGIRHVLRKLKDAGLAEEDSLYAIDAVQDVQDQVQSRAVAWYKIGARRGALEVLDALLAGRLAVNRKPDGSTEIVAEVKKIEWRRKLKVKVGTDTRTVKERTYRLTLEDLGFES
jgi:hypothetical protein